MNNWKVEAGTCSCRLPRRKDLPIDFTPTHEPGLCPICFSKGEISHRTIRDRLGTMKENEKELLLRNFCGAHLERRHAPTTRYQMVKFGVGLSDANTEIPSMTEYSGPSSTSDKVVETLYVYRFSWGNNPDPEAIRRLLYDDIPNAKYALMRNYSRWEDVQIRPILVCKTSPSRENSAWKSIIDAANNWPFNPTKVRVEIFSNMLARYIRMVKKLGDNREL